MRPYFEKMQDWGKPVKVNAANEEQIKKVEQEIAALVEQKKNAGLPREVLNKRGEWTVHQRLEYILDPGTWAPLHLLMTLWTKSPDNRCCGCLEGSTGDGASLSVSITKSWLVRGLPVRLTIS